MSPFFKKTIYIIVGLAILSGVAVTFSVTKAQVLTDAQRQALQAQLDQIEQQIAAQQKILSQKQQEGVSISRDIAILDAKIAEAQLKIKAHNIAIAQLGRDINVKNQVIGTLSNKISEGKDSLGQIIRQSNQIDGFSLPEVFFSKLDLSQFFADVGAYDSLNQSLQTFFGKVETAKAQTETEKNTLDQKRSQELDLRASIQQEQASIKKDEASKASLLALNKQQQKNYQSLITANKIQADKIRNALFPLLDTSAIKFGDALQYATAASAKTSVRPAFVLAILTQETNLGANIGSCYLTGTDGNGIKIKTGAFVGSVMKQGRDVQPFLDLMVALHRDPYHTPVSCPQSVGYGGGMGPSQFIASTWDLMENQISAVTGHKPPDPYNPPDAIMASSLYLGNLGAGAGTYTAERNAACKYYSGRACGSGNTSYGDSVMSIATKIQSNIDVLQGN